MSARRLGSGATAAAAMWLAASGAWAAISQPISAGPMPRLVVDDFEDPAAWNPAPASGVELHVSADQGVHGRALRLDFDFHGGGGYAVVHRAVSLDLPANYRFTFAVRGECRPNDLEFKLIDSSGDDVWWLNRRRFAFPATWDSLTSRKRQITFAWGPSDAPLTHVAAIEFAVTAGEGGKGTVWLDDLALEPLPVVSGAPPAPVARASSAATGHGAVLAVDRDHASFWAGGTGDRRPWLALDLGVEREFGGITIEWAPGRAAADYDVQFSDDGARWRTGRAVRGGNGGDDPLDLPESEARYLRVRAARDVGTRGIAIRDVAIEPLAWGESPNAFFQALAQAAPRGNYPRGMSGEQVYWTVVGANGGEEEALLSEDGALETGKGRFSIEPFLEIEGAAHVPRAPGPSGSGARHRAAAGPAPERFITWNDAETAQDLDQGLPLPLPVVTWSADDLALHIEAFPVDSSTRSLPSEFRALVRGGSGVIARYRISNRGSLIVHGALDLALRPFQVNPPTQFLGEAGGVAEIRELACDGPIVRADRRAILALTPPDDFGAATFDAGDIAQYLREGRLPRSKSVHDSTAHASGALRYRFVLAPGAAQDFALFVPLHEEPPTADASTISRALEQLPLAERASEVEWRRLTAGVRLDLPPPAAEIARTLNAQIGWILVNRDGPAIQPGSRAYDRSWIRDGSLTSSALLRAGHTREAKAFVEWFAEHQYADGKVPCCVDQRGADPVPEHDSHGELIFAAAEVVRFTGDRAFAERLWPHVARAAAYLDSLRHQRLGPEWNAPDKREFKGLLPPSISHEGYSAKPMHSYWDDLFALRGFKDAAWMAGYLGKSAESRHWRATGDAFARDLAASIVAAMKRHAIDYVPGCADLGDFDATSTTIALDPVQAGAAVPKLALARAFERYWEFFRARRDSAQDWDAFTPYEIRNIGAFVRLGWRDRAQELLDYFMRYRRPPGWRQWAEVVGREERKPRFIGDMPHTWVGSDFVRSVLDLFAYERESDSTLVIAAGVPLQWTSEAPGVAVHGLTTPHGLVGYTLRSGLQSTTIAIEDGLAIPRGGILVLAPTAGRAKRATIDGKPAPITPEGAVIVRKVPATVVMEW